MLTRYFETLKQTLEDYVYLTDNGSDPMALINSQEFFELYAIQFVFIQNTFRSFVASLWNSTNGDYTSIIDTRMALFIVFIIALAITYLILWTPFVNKLNREVSTSIITRIDLEDQVHAHHHSHRGYHEDPAHSGVSPQPEFLPEQGKFLPAR